MMSPDEEEAMINDLLRVLRISEEWMDAKALTVEDGSAFAGDDAKHIRTKSARVSPSPLP